MTNNKIKLENIHRSWKTYKNFNQRRAWKKNPKSIKGGPMFILDSRVTHS